LIPHSPAVARSSDLAHQVLQQHLLEIVAALSGMSAAEVPATGGLESLSFEIPSSDFRAIAVSLAGIFPRMAAQLQVWQRYKQRVQTSTFVTPMPKAPEPPSPYR